MFDVSLEKHKIRSFINLSRKHAIRNFDKQNEWGELNYKAAIEIGRKINEKGPSYLSYEHHNPYISGIVHDVIQKRKEIDSVLGIGSYLVGKCREKDVPYILNTEESALSKWTTNILKDYAHIVARTHFPDRPENEVVKDILKNGLKFMHEIEDTSYGFKFTPKSPDEKGNLVLYSPGHYDNNKVIERAMEHLSNAVTFDRIADVTKELTSFKRDFIIATPFVSGTSSFADIIEKAVFESKEISYFNYKRNSPSRDVVAFLCPDYATYHKEYMNLQQIQPGTEKNMIAKYASSASLEGGHIRA